MLFLNPPLNIFKIKASWERSQYKLSSQQELLKQGVVWLKSRLDLLVRNMVANMDSQEDLTFNKLPGIIRKLVAKDMLQDLIKRLENSTFEAEEVRKKMTNGLKKGATMQSLVTCITIMVEVISTEARRGLAGQPEVRDLLINKTEYFANLLKASVATAAIELERAKMNNSK